MHKHRPSCSHSSETPCWKISIFARTGSLSSHTQTCDVSIGRKVKLLACLVGDALMEPFWPQGTGANKAILAALDTAWMLRSYFVSSEDAPAVQWLIQERAHLFNCMQFASPDNLLTPSSGKENNRHNNACRNEVNDLDPAGRYETAASDTPSKRPAILSSLDNMQRSPKSVSTPSFKSLLSFVSPPASQQRKHQSPTTSEVYHSHQGRQNINIATPSRGTKARGTGAKYSTKKFFRSLLRREASPSGTLFRRRIAKKPNHRSTENQHRPDPPSNPPRVDPPQTLDNFDRPTTLAVSHDFPTQLSCAKLSIPHSEPRSSDR